jgi:hypothetical protein
MSTSTSDRFAVPASDDRLTRAGEALATRGFEVRQVDTAGAARGLVADLLPTDRTIFTTASETLLKAKAPHEQGLQQMGGTGLEPVTPSLSSPQSWCSLFAALGAY